MSRLILPSLIAAAFLLTGSNLYAGDNDKPQNESTKDVQSTNQETQSTKKMDQAMGLHDYQGEVTAINADTVTIKDDSGIEHTVKITGFQDLRQLQAETLETGDEVKVLTRNGKPYAISKVEEAWLSDVDMPDLAETETIKGRVTDVNGDTIKIKDDNGTVHTADITGFQDMQELEVETIEEGDIVVVNVRDGKTYGISKHTEAWLVN
jgi:heme-degrading monooxygenase HmoA